MGADLKGFSQLPKGDSAYLMPIIPLARVPNAKRFQNTLDKVRTGLNGVGEVFIADIGDKIGLELPAVEMEEVHKVFRELSGAAGGFLAWRQFIRENPDMIPVLRFGSAADLLAQVEDFADLGRGMVLRIRSSRHQGVGMTAAPAIQYLARRNKLDHLLIVVDLEHIDEPLAPAAMAAGLVRTLIAAAGNRRVNVAISATSFPLELKGVAEEIIRYPIKERILHHEFERILGPGAVNLFYSDYGSARTRADEEKGGKGYPRIDYAARNRWPSNRQKGGLPEAHGFQAAANKIMATTDWVEELDIYGANMIREAADGLLEKRKYAGFWVSARINLHLHRQAHYSSTDAEFLGTEGEWED
ncbi:protein of unknown function(Protein beta,3-341) [Magnetospirillum sp. XM-1]|nr:protein of unknown function(Protein beta,3-341) [Magnetospirillum sp. XM-1]